MANRRHHLSRAPITEALIDLQVRQRKSVDLDVLRSLVDAFNGYQLQGPILALQTRWEVTKEQGASETSVSHEIGQRLHSEDGKYVLQVRLNGFTLSRLEPYESWTELLSEVKKEWGIYRARIRPEAIIRVATRYINKLKLPMAPGEHFEAYLTKPPAVPGELPQGVSGFMQRLVILNPVIDARANVIQLLPEGPSAVDHVAVVLDIDVYRAIELAPETDAVWNLLAELRVFKNEIFFAYSDGEGDGAFRMTTITADQFRYSTAASNSAAEGVAASSLIQRMLVDAANQAASSLPARAFADLARVSRQCSKEGWDGYDAKPITQTTCARAQAFLDNLPLWMPPPDIVPEADGEIAIEWYFESDHTFSISIGEHGPLHYAGLFGYEDEVHGIKGFDGCTVPTDIISLIDRLTREATASRAA